MKNTLRKIFWPILNRFEKGEGTYNYKPSHRKILIVVGCLLLMLSLVSFYFLFLLNAPGALLPVLIFFSAAMVCIVVGFLGSDRAVARIWRNR